MSKYVHHESSRKHVVDLNWVDGRSEGLMAASRTWSIPRQDGRNVASKTKWAGVASQQCKENRPAENEPFQSPGFLYAVATQPKRRKEP